MAKVDDHVAELERKIRTGQLLPGERLPPVRDFAEQNSLAPNTAAAVYKSLGARGLVQGEGRRGTFVTAKPPVRVSVADQIPEDVINLAQGNPDGTLFPDLRSALSVVPDEPLLYGADQVVPDLGARFLAEFAHDGIDASELAIVAGALDAIERVLGAHLRFGDMVGIEDPGYSAVLELVAAMGFRPVPIAVDEDGPKTTDMAAALEAGVAAVIVTPRAQNPTGAAISVLRAKELRKALSASPHVLVIEDDHAGPIAGTPYESVIASNCTHWAIARSVAKTLGPDLRVCALTGDATTIARVRGRQAVGTGWVSHILQHAALAMMTSRNYAQDVARAAKAYAAQRDAFCGRLADGGMMVSAKSGLNVWVPVDDEAGVVSAMRQRGFAIASGASYRTDAPPGIRVTVAGHDEETLAAAAEELLDVLRSGWVRRGA